MARERERGLVVTGYIYLFNGDLIIFIVSNTFSRGNITDVDQPLVDSASIGHLYHWATIFRYDGREGER